LPGNGLLGERTTLHSPVTEGEVQAVRILIAGMDGYLGWSLAQHLTGRGHDVAGADAMLRRAWVAEMRSASAIPIASINDRLAALREHTGQVIPFWSGDLRNYDLVERMFREFEPEAIVHLSECPSAPYSMIDREHAMFVQLNNLTTTFNLLFAIRDLAPDAHLLKLGTMGEYGTPNVAIPEGFFEIEYRGRKDLMPFPRQAPSWYHWSKVHGSNNIMFASKIWGLRATDVMQGVVFGTRIDGMGDDPRLRTRLDFDQAFGTAINRFSCQAVIGHPLTPYGAGGQVRGFLPLRDSMQCLTLGLEHPPEAGEYRVFNQFEETYSIRSLADIVKDAALALDLKVDIAPVENPRAAIERQDHYFAPDHQRLADLGYQPTHDVATEVRRTLEDLLPHQERIGRHQQALLPDVHWNGARRQVDYIGGADADRDPATAAGMARDDAAASAPVSGSPDAAVQGYLPFHRPSIEEEDVAAVRRVLESGWLTHGPVCQEFETTFAAQVQADRAVAVSSGTAALHLALVALGVGAGDEVITTPMTFCSCAQVIEHVGATPVFADIDSVTMQIDPAQIETVLGPRTKAIIAVDYGGHPCRIEEIVKMASGHGVAVLEDAAHSLGAAVGDRPIGSIADVTAFSFYATKNITTGEGGMLTTSDSDLADRVERLRLHGIDREAWRRYRKGGSWSYEVAELGFKANLTDIQAALGLSQLRREPSIRARREAIAARYSRSFTELGELAELPVVEEGVRSAWHLYPFRLAGAARMARDQLIEDLEALGIGSSVHFVPIHLKTYLKERMGFRGGEFPVCEDACTRVLSLPLYAAMSDADVERVISAVTNLVRSYAR
jgi:UDP-sulfoquinovose synthase